MGAAPLSFEFGHLWPVALLLAVVAGGVCARVYFVPEGGGRRVRWLPVLRAAALLLVALSVLGPVWKRPLRDSEAGEFAVILDTSKSMSIVDTQRSPGERLLLAIALGRFSDPLEEVEVRRRELLDELREAVESVVSARAAVEFAEVTRVDPTEPRERWAVARDTLADSLRAAVGAFPKSCEPLLRGIVTTAEAGTLAWAAPSRQRLAELASALADDTRQRMARLVAEDPAASEAAASVSNLSRLEIAQALLTEQAKLLPPGVPLRLIASHRPGSESRDANAGEVPGLVPAEVQSLVADGESSDLKRLLTRVSSPVGERRLRGIVVLSDGRDIVSGTLDGIAPGVRVHTVAVAPGSPPPAVRVVSFSVPQTMVTGQTATVRAVMVGTSADPSRVGDAPGATEVRLLLPGQTQSRRVEIVPGVPVAVEFDLVADRSGDLPLELVVQPRPGDAPGTAVRLSRTVRITGERVRVLLVSSAPTWDIQHLTRTLTNTPWVRLTSARTTDDLASLFARSDTVILSDVAASRLDSGARLALRDLIDRRAGVLLLLPGPTRLPETWFSDPELNRYLPSSRAEWVRSPSAEGSFTAASVRLPSGSDAPIRTNLAASAGGFWRLLNWGTLSEAASVVLLDPATTLPVLTEKRVGLGRVLTLHTDQFWRTGPASPTAAGTEPGASPWAALVGLLAERPFAASFGGVSMDAQVRPLPADVGPPGRAEVWVRLKVLSSDGTPSLVAPSRLVLRSAGRTVLAVAASADGPGRFVATLSPVPRGVYSLELEGQPEPRLRLEVGDGGEAELADPAGDRGALERLARVTGGTAVAAENAAELAPALDSPGTPEGLRTIRLWNAPGMLVLILSLLVAEWALRKHWGLA